MVSPDSMRGDPIGRAVQTRIEEHLRHVMWDASLQPKERLAAGERLDALGRLPDDLYDFVRVEVPDPPPGCPEVVWVARYDEGWRWLRSELEAGEKVVLPRYRRHPRLGTRRRGDPVVGVSWFEVNAYCRRLAHHWAELEEGRRNAGLAPALIRLLMVREWVAAAGSEDPPERFPWGEPRQGVTSEEGEVLARANVAEARLGDLAGGHCTRRGASRLYGLRDLAGNVWERQANFSDRGHGLPRPARRLVELQLGPRAGVGAPLRLPALPLVQLRFSCGAAPRLSGCLQ